MDTVTPTKTEINDVYAELYDATYAHQTAMIAQTEAKTALDRAIVIATADGVIVGKNQLERDAIARKLFADQYDNLDALTATAAQARLRFSLAEIEVARVRLQMRRVEVTAVNAG